jgi:hypothetical protein
MKMYRDANGEFHRTQLEAKATKLTFSPIDVPTDSHGLCEFLNMMNPPAEYLPQIRAIMSRPPGVIISDTSDEIDSSENDYEPPETLIDPDRPYRNGDPTLKFMGSRNPEAVFTCVFCGKNNHNKATK